MSIASVLIPSDKPDGAVTSSPGPRYSLLLSTDPSLIEAAQRLRYDVFSSTPGFTLPGVGDGQTDVDRFDEYCDHLLVRDDDTGELVGCYRMLAPAGAIAAGGLYTATEFDLGALDPLRPSLEDLLDMITSGVRSSFTYAGASTVDEFHDRALVGIQSAAGYEEGKALPVSW